MPDLWNLAVALNCPVQFLDTFDEKLEAPHTSPGGVYGKEPDWNGWVWDLTAV